MLSNDFQNFVREMCMCVSVFFLLVITSKVRTIGKFQFCKKYYRYKTLFKIEFQILNFKYFSSYNINESFSVDNKSKVSSIENLHNMSTILDKKKS